MQDSLLFYNVCRSEKVIGWLVQQGLDEIELGKPPDININFGLALSYSKRKKMHSLAKYWRARRIYNTAVASIWHRHELKLL